MANNGGNIIAALLAGVVIGGVAGLLFAPKSGEALRNELATLIKEKLPNLNREELEALLSKAMTRAKDWFNDKELEQVVNEVIEEAADEAPAKKDK